MESQIRGQSTMRSPMPPFLSTIKRRLKMQLWLLKGEKIVEVGSNVQIPNGAIVIDVKGKYIYPAFIDMYTSYGLPEVPKKSGGSLQYDSEKKQAFGWNDHVKADFHAVDHFSSNIKEALNWQKTGFGAVLTHRPDGIVRGTSAMVTVADAPASEVVLLPRAASHFSFSRSQSHQIYPKSIMGVVALIRQTYYDAAWYEKAPEKELNLTLEAFNQNKSLPQIFEARSNKLRVLLADEIGDEFGVQYIIKGNGDEYQRADAIKATGAALILPLKFPDPYDVSDPLAEQAVSLTQMKHWEMAPFNAKILQDKGIQFAFTTEGVSEAEFWKALRTLPKTGLDQSEILKSLTQNPAKFLSVDDKIGALKKGMLANFFVSSGDIFDVKSSIHETWVQGKRSVFSELEKPNYAGNYVLEVDTVKHRMEIINIGGKHSAVIHRVDSTILPLGISLSEYQISLNIKTDSSDFRLSGWIGEDGFGGVGKEENGNAVKWKATRQGEPAALEQNTSTVIKSDSIGNYGQLIYPFSAYGTHQTPQPEKILFKNATVWTLEKDSVIAGGDVLIDGGKILKVGKNLSSEGAKIIDATGKHLAPGIIDEHSHIALFSVNESSLAVTSEVRMRDAINSEDINIYRQLAGGVVAAQLLHGSANPIGGQSAIVKLRWGATPREMLIAEADPFIKLALGENVKQSNWGDDYKIRFPQTRMGVEQVFIDAFTQAQAYGQAKTKYEALNKKAQANASAPRTDLRLEALLEIINSQRFITCHSYVQSEINMLMKVAESFDFRVNTFTHVLEGYKLADKLAKHGAGGSTFADWWGYKFEVRDAIPYNAALMSAAGVTVAINSDNPEMARRLNQEAAKTVKYGGVSEVEALKMITLNPAKLLHLDDHMGSIKVGKDADLVLWSDHPLSIYAKVEMTFVDGAEYYSLEKDLVARKYLQNERARLIEKMIEAKKGGAATQQAEEAEEESLHCDSVGEIGELNLEDYE